MLRHRDQPGPAVVPGGRPSRGLGHAEPAVPAAGPGGAGGPDGPGRLAAEPGAAADLATLSAGLPLAIGVIAARAVTGPPRPLADLAAELRAAPAWLAAPRFLDDLPGPGGGPGSAARCYADAAADEETAAGS